MTRVFKGRGRGRRIGGVIYVAGNGRAAVKQIGDLKS